MKHLLLIVTVLTFSYQSFAQLPELYGPIFEHQDEILDALSKGATWMKISEKSKEDEPSSNSIVEMENNEIKTITRFAANGNKINTTVNEYSAEGHLIKSTTVSPNEKELARVEIAYNHNGLPISRIDYEKGDIVKKQTTWYNAGEQLEKHIEYSAGGNLVENQWLYNYRDNGELFHTFLVNPKNDTVSVWTYDCNKNGRLKRAKNETEICIWDEKDRFGNTLKFEKRISKSEVTLRKVIIDPNNLKTASVLYNEKERVIERFSYDYVNGLLVEKVNHQPNDNDGIINKETRDYTEKGNLYNKVFYNSKNEPTKFLRYEYQF